MGVLWQDHVQLEVGVIKEETGIPGPQRKEAFPLPQAEEDVDMLSCYRGIGVREHSK